MATNREPRWDNIKFFLIFLVVLGHFAENFTGSYAGFRALFVYIYTFHMPAFLFISGLFSKRIVDAKRFSWTKTIPYLVLCAFLNFYRNLSLYAFDISKGFHFKNQNNISWFLFVLFFMYLITYLVKKFPEKNVLITSILLALLAGFDGDISKKWALSRIIVFFPFFYLGYIIDRKDVERFLDNKLWKAASLLIMVGYAAFIFFFIDSFYGIRTFFTGQNSYNEIFDEFTLYAPLIRLACYIATTVTMFAFMALIPKGHIPIISKAGQYTLGVYFWHLPVATVLNNLIPLMAIVTINMTRELIYCCAAALVLSLFFSIPVFSWPLDWVLRPGKRHTLTKEERQAKKAQKKALKEGSE